MPGAVSMENGNSTDLAGSQSKVDMAALKEQAHEVVAAEQTATNINGHQMTIAIRSNDLPPEIIHISEGFIPLSRLITRLAQLTHNQLMDKIRQVAAMPMPTAPPQSANGNPAPAPGASQKEEFDQSNESVARKVALNSAIQKMHGRWIKTLVIADWSRKSKDVSKLIDLNTHLRLLMQEYELRLDQMINVKRDLTYARLPSPDIKTALHVLSAGDGSFFPDLQYLQPQPMTDEEVAKWVEDINTFLTIRLNVDDYDNIPVHFHNYTIANGRVTFKVPGEFEVELTIADEDPSTQFWFVDFRFDCSPAPNEVSAVLRSYLEMMVNTTIASDNLTGCYKFLHEFVMTHKISEIRRQALEMSKSSWSNALIIEPLDRALAIQYWPKRLGPNNSKHWVIVAVDGHRKQTGWVNPKTTSNLRATWFRNGKPVKDEEIKFDTVNVSAEALMTLVIGKHIEHIFKSMYDKLKLNKRYSSCQSHLSIHIDHQDPARSYLRMQCSKNETITVYIEPTTGEFKLDSHSKESLQAETKLNNLANPAVDGGQTLDGIRYLFVNEELSRKSTGTGWICFKNRLLPDDVKSVLKIRDSTFWSFCMQRKDMLPTWLVICVCRTSGDEWYLCKVQPHTANSGFKFASPHAIKLDVDLINSDMSPRVWSNFTTYVHTKMAENANLSQPANDRLVMRTDRCPNRLDPGDYLQSRTVLKLSTLVPRASVACGSHTPKDDSACCEPDATKNLQRDRGPWANDTVTIFFTGVEPADDVPPGAPINSAGRPIRPPMWTCVCIVRVLDKKKFRALGPTMGRDIEYNGITGEFWIRVQRNIGDPIRSVLQPRLQAIDRVVDFLDAMNVAGPAVRHKSVTLSRVSFYYTDATGRLDKKMSLMEKKASGQIWSVMLDLSQPGKITLLLDDRDPHQMAGIMLTRLANEPNGLRMLVRTLPRTLPLMEAFSEIVARSPERMANNQGAVRVLHMSPGASSLIYLLASGGTSLRLDVKLRLRAGSVWWTLERVATDGRPLSVHNELADEGVVARLRDLFSTPDAQDRWVALGTGLTTRGIRDVKAMIKAADEQVWGV